MFHKSFIERKDTHTSLIEINERKDTHPSFIEINEREDTHTSFIGINERFLSSPTPSSAGYSGLKIYVRATQDQ